MKVVFFGSPDFAVASLQALLDSNHIVTGVITQPDRPKGRGMKMGQPPVKELALKHGLPIFQPEKVNQPETFDFLKTIEADIFAVVAYGGFLGTKLLGYCKHAPVNVHPSLLPELRGAAPMNWTLINGLEKTGVTTQCMVKQMDAGPVIMQTTDTLSGDETTVDLHEKYKVVGGDLLVQTLDAIENGTASYTEQDESNATFAPLLDKKMGNVDWQKPAQTIYNLWRGLTPWPGIFSFYDGKRLKLNKVHIAQNDEAPMQLASPGDLIPYGDALFVQTGEGFLSLDEVQLEGKKAVLPKEFCNGMKNEKKLCRQ